MISRRLAEAVSVAHKFCFTTDGTSSIQRIKRHKPGRERLMDLLRTLRLHDVMLVHFEQDSCAGAASEEIL